MREKRVLLIKEEAFERHGVFGTKTDTTKKKNIEMCTLYFPTKKEKDQRS